jgi:hypothetical protein
MLDFHIDFILSAFIYHRDTTLRQKSSDCFEFSTTNLFCLCRVFFLKLSNYFQEFQ